MRRALEVVLHGSPIGELVEDDGAVELRFLESYRNSMPRPILGQKFEDDPGRTSRARRSEKLPDFFANLLPEGRLAEIVVESADLEPDDDLALLAFVGRDLAGAVAANPIGDSWPAASRAAATPNAPTPETPGNPPESLRFSLAGVQLKFSMLREGKQLSLPAHGQEGEWIVKFPSPSFPGLPENEASMLLWAREAGFDVPEAFLHDAEDLEGFPRQHSLAGSRVLAVRRYDRSRSGRIHQEDFAQVVGLPPRSKYDQISYDQMAQLIRKFVDEEAVDELVRRLGLVLATGNNDAHLKNWSLIYPDRVRARWSPIYDQVATVAWPALDRRLALSFAGIKEFGRIDRSTLERFAKTAAMEENRVFHQVEAAIFRLRQTWRQIAKDLPLPTAHAEALREHWRRVPLLRELGGLE